MNRLFGKKKEPRPGLAETSERIDTRCEVVDVRMSKIDAELAKLRSQMQNAQGPALARMKQRALQLIQQKRSYQKQQDGMRAQQFNMDQVQFAVQTMNDTEFQIKAMKDANKQLAKQTKKLNVNQVEDLQLDLTDHYADVQEIQEIMGRSYDVPEDLDDDEMLAELNALDCEGESVNTNYIDQALALPTPSVPGGPVGQNVSMGETPEEKAKNNDPLSLEAQLGL